MREYNRVQSIDFLRGIAIILMIWAHFMWWLVDRRIIYIYFGFGTPIDIQISYTGIQQILGVISNFYPVPVFFTLVGISLVFSISNKKVNGISDYKIRIYILKRSLFILLISYFVFNLFIKGPLLFFYHSWDMLHLISIGILITYLLLKLSKIPRLVIAIIIVMLSPIIQIIFNYEEIHYLYPIQGGIISNMIYSGEFPIFPWLYFVIFGSIIGEILKDASETKDISSWLKKFVIFGFLFIVSGAILPILNIPTFTTFYKYPCTIPYVLFFSGAVLISLSIMYYLFDYKKFKMNFFNPVIQYGKLALTIFLVHFFIGYRFTKIIGIYESFSYWSACLIILGFYFVCWIVLVIWSNYQYTFSFEWLMRKISYSHFKKKKKGTEI